MTTDEQSSGESSCIEAIAATRVDAAHIARLAGMVASCGRSVGDSALQGMLGGSDWEGTAGDPDIMLRARLQYVSRDGNTAWLIVDGEKLETALRRTELLGAIDAQQFLSVDGLLAAWHAFGLDNPYVIDESGKARLRDAVKLLVLAYDNLSYAEKRPFIAQSLASALLSAKRTDRIVPPFAFFLHHAACSLHLLVDPHADDPSIKRWIDDSFRELERNISTLR